MQNPKTVTELLRNIPKVVKFGLDRSGTKDQVIVIGKDGSITLPSAQDGVQSFAIAGSAAVRHLQLQLLDRADEMKLKGVWVTRARVWQPQDLDFYKLGRSRLSHTKHLVANIKEGPVGDYAVKHADGLGIELIDIVYSPATSLQELLLGFDFAAARAAIAFDGTIWCSLHCLASLFSGKFLLPAALQTEAGCKQLLEVIQKEQRGTFDAAHEAKLLMESLSARLEKYAQRGFQAVYALREAVPAFVLNRLTFARLYDKSYTPPLSPDS